MKTVFILSMVLSATYLSGQSDTLVFKNGEKYAVNIIKTSRGIIQFEMGGKTRKVNEDELLRVISCNLETKIDEFTGDTSSQTKILTLSDAPSTRIVTIVSRSNSTFLLTIVAFKDIGCVGSDSQVIFKFDNGEMLNLRHIGEIDCGDASFICFIKDGDAMDMCLENPISRIRLSADEGNIDFDPIDKYFLMNSLSCLTKAY